MARSFRIAVVLTSLSLAGAAMASKGGITGYSGKENRSCNACHDNPGGALSPTVKLDGPAALEAGTRASYTFRIVTDAAGTGFNAAASEGELIGNVEAGVQAISGEVTHTAPRDAGTTTYAFDFLAPQYGGTVTLYASGNAVNLNGQNTGDQSSRTSIDVAIDGPPKPAATTTTPPPVATTPPPQVDSGVPRRLPATAPEEDDGGCAVSHGPASPFGAAIGVLVAALAVLRGRRRVTR
jgi:MYXO-CTERM domain-containing protein